MWTRCPLSALTARTIAAAHEVHQGLGPGVEEVIYQRALEIELPMHGVECTREVWIDVVYRDRGLGRKRVDFVADDESGDLMINIKEKGASDPVDHVRPCRISMPASTPLVC